MSVASSSQTTPRDDFHIIELLTTQALEAAQCGDWDRVDACYDARARGLASCKIDRACAQRILAVDDRVREAILVAQAGLSSLLADAAQARRHLRRLRESHGQHEPEHGTLHHEA
ncbi:MAG: hypothetical protein H8K06_21145 [Nitrospira sp.]|uniref:Flagellar protein FliT n=1 Tax=Nitrospira defluvii TaxID=330214 RepID=A0ABN7LYY1_9BACT|nr:hypothetical protein [Nitrospira defluvii]MCS6329555.1 hypothetical protein [Nitrospira sp.]CAE6776520.1 conserved hypothetical protein [Nitrospira defluvii]